MIITMMAWITVSMKVSQRIRMLAVTALFLSACSGGDEPLELSESYEPEPEPVAVVEPQIDAATIDPCANDFLLQREINGAPDDSTVERSVAAGKSLTTLRYWYADTGTIIGFRYAEGEAWCNVWSESGLTWIR